MEFPVDVLASVSHEHLELSGHAYMDDLLRGDPEDARYFLLPSGRKVPISLSSVGFVPLYGANLEHKILALFGPEDPLTAVALLLSDRWYAVENVLRTASASREGLLQVTSVVERVVLYVLNRIVYRTNEMSTGDILFLCHDKNDYAKILWKGGEAVGFYSVKTKGSWSQFYYLPVMNSIFVRKGHRGNGHGLQMLEDFVDSFNEDELGLKYPLSAAMLRVCQRYLSRYPADVNLLWEVEGVGGPYQRSHLASRLSAHALTGCQDGHKNGTVAEGAVDIITEEAVINKHLTPAEEVDHRPISTRTRSSENGCRKREREEPVEGAAEVPPQKISRGAEQLPEPMEPSTAAISTPEHEDGLPPAGVMAVLSVSCAAEQEAKELVEGSKETVPGQAEEDEESSFQNGTAEEEEQEEIQVAIHSVDTLQETGGGATVSQGKCQEEQEMDKDPASDKQQEEEVANDTQEEKSAAEVEGEQKQEVTGEVGVAENAEKHEVPRSFVEEQEEEKPPVEEQEEGPAPSLPGEGKQEVDEEKVASLTADEKQEAGPVEEEEEVESVGAEAPPPEGETTNPEEMTGTPVKEGGPEAPKDEEGLCVSQVDSSEQSQEEDLKENEQEEEEKRAEQKEGRMESQEKAGGVGGGAHPDTPDDGRVPRGGRSKTCSLRKSGTAAVQGEEGQEPERADAEDEKVTTEEEDEGQDEEPHVMDMRVLRRNTRAYQTTTQHRVKRRSKM